MDRTLSGDDFLRNMDKSKLKVMENVDGLIPNVLPYLGSFDATTEWNSTPSLAQRIFLHTGSYRAFINESALILLGRTGTGKTSILQCLCADVNNGKEKRYTRAIYLPFGPLLEELQRAFDSATDAECLHSLDSLIEIYINICVMKDIVQNKGDLDIRFATKEIERFLAENGTDKRPVLDIINDFLNGIQPLNENKSAQFVYAVKDLIFNLCDRLKKDCYVSAVQEMQKGLADAGSKYLVLIDNADGYSLQDAKVCSIVKSLIRNCFDYYNNSAQTHIYIKVSIPSEIYTSIVAELPGKRQGNTIVIQWSRNELKRMIAMRLCLFFAICKDKAERFDFTLPEHPELFNLPDFENVNIFYDNHPDSISHADKLLSVLFPPECPTALSFSTDTFSYLVHHTLKKPREIMILFNYFIKMIDMNNDLSYFINHPEEIARTIHSTQEAMINPALSMYENSYPKIGEACDTVLAEMDFCFRGKELSDRLKDAQKDKSYDAAEIKRILLESGLVGRVTNVCTKEISTNTEQSSVSMLYLMSAVFEYQVKGKLHFRQDSVYVIHPMCYEHFSCKVHENTLVLPGPLDSVDEIIKSLKLKR